MESLHYLRVLRRRWHWVAAAAILGAVLGAISALLADDSAQPENPNFSAIHSLYSPSFTLPQSEFETVRLITSSGLVADRTGAILDLSPEAVATRIHVVVSPQLQTIEVVATGTDPEATATLANTYADQILDYRIELSKQGLDQQIVDQTERIDQLEEDVSELEAEVDADEDNTPAASELGQAERHLAEARLLLESLESRGAEVGQLTTLRAATAVPINLTAFRQDLDELVIGQDTAEEIELNNTAHSAPQEIADPVTRAILGSIVLAVCAVGVVFTIDRLDPRLTTRVEAETTFGLDVIAEIPTFSRRRTNTTDVVAAERPLSREAESYRRLRSTLEYLGLGDRERTDGPKVLMISSPGPAEGKTTTLANLAAMYAETGCRVLVINCDFRRPKIHHFLANGQTDQRVVESHIANIHVVPNVANQDMAHRPAEVVARQRSVIENARDHFDVVLLDTAPLLTTNDATELLNYADLVLLVAKVGRTDVESAFLTAEQLRRREIKVAGVVLTGAIDMPSSSRYYYYRSHLESEMAGPPRRPPSDDPPDADNRVPLWPGGSGTSSGGGDRSDSAADSDPDGSAAESESESVR